MLQNSGDARNGSHDCNEGTTTTLFDLTVLNELDRFHLLLSVIDQVPKLAKSGDPVSRGGDPGETR